MKHHIMVCVLAGPAELLDMGQCLPIAKLRPEPIGYMEGYSFDDLTDCEGIKRDLEGFGLEAKYLIHSVKAEHGCRGALINLAVSVRNWEDAQKLPGFVPFGEWSGAYFMPPSRCDFAFSLPEDQFEDRAIKRILIEDAYDDFEPPLYEDGVFSYSLIPMGRLGRHIFFEDDPTHFYVVTHGVRDHEEEVEQLEWVRRFKDKCLAE